MLRLGALELDAIRGLQAGVHDLPVDDPLWPNLVAVGLVKLSSARPQLTRAGWRYRTD
jgi:hypothetical protein